MPQVKIIRDLRFRQIGGVRRSLRRGKVINLTEAEASDLLREGAAERVAIKASAKAKRPTTRSTKKKSAKKTPKNTASKAALAKKKAAKV